MACLLPNLRISKFLKFNPTIFTSKFIESRDYKNSKSGFPTENGGKTIENNQIELYHN